MNARAARAAEMLRRDGAAVRDGGDSFKVRSQSVPSKSYSVRRTGSGLVCSCPDHAARKADCKHIQVVLEIMKRDGAAENGGFRIMERPGLKLCKFCDSGNITRKGFRKTEAGRIQMYACRDCGRRSAGNPGFEGRRFAPEVIAGALQMYYTGMSVRDIADHYGMLGIGVSHMAVYNWIAEYSDSVSSYLDGIVPRTTGRVMARADEIWIRVAGVQKYLFASMDDYTRYWLAAEMADTKYQHNADALLLMTKKALGRPPAHFVTDGLPAYKKSSRKVFGPRTQHWRHIHLKGDMNNNKMERLNGEIRDREKVFRGLKREDTPLIGGLKAYYNYTKKHSGIGGMTPAEAAGIHVDGGNKWITLIQNAALRRG